MKKITKQLLLLIIIISISSPTAYAGASLRADSHNAVEALVQIYRPMDGEFEYSEDTRFYIVSNGVPDENILDTVSLMAREFSAVGPRNNEIPSVAYGGERKAQAGDIVIKMAEQIDFAYGGDMADDTEAYSMEIGDKVCITAVEADGVYYGLITLLEMLQEKDQKGDIHLSGCKIYDGPDIKERTIFLDCGRKYFSKKWIEKFIRRSSFQRYNTIQLHFTEAQGIRLDSEKFPWLTKGIDSLSREGMAEIVALAKQYHMDVIPSIDTPGHNEYMVKKYASYVKKHPDWSFEYRGDTYSRENTEGFKKIANHYSYNGKKKAADYIGIDITKKHAVAFVDALIDDYADFFAELGCSRFAIGGDEVFGWYDFELGGKNFSYGNRWSAFEHWAKYARETLGIKKGSAEDAFVNYMNTIAERLEKKGYTCRMFNDEVYISKRQHIKLKDSIEMQFWSPAAGNYSGLEGENRKIYLDIPRWSYYVVRTLDGKDIMKNKYSMVTAENIYKKWVPDRLNTPSGTRTVPADQLGGAYFNIWCDDASYKSSEKIWKETTLRTWASASRMWNKEINSGDSGMGRALPYQEFKEFAENMVVKATKTIYNGKVVMEKRRR